MFSKPTHFIQTVHGLSFPVFSPASNDTTSSAAQRANSGSAGVTRSADMNGEDDGSQKQ